MLDTAPKPAPDVLGGHEVSAFTDALADSPDRSPRIRYPDEVQLDDVTAPLRLLQNIRVGRPLRVDSSAKRSPPPIISPNALSSNLPALNATASGRSGDSPRAIFIRVQQPSHTRTRQELARDRRLPRAIAAADQVKAWS